MAKELAGNLSRIGRPLPVVTLPPAPAAEPETGTA
jgi:hypothetical protein